MDIGTVLRAVAALPLPDAARTLAEAGVPVFPCRLRGKEPRTEHGFHDASAKPRQVAAWWRRWPTANIGVPTGAASGFEVVDVDVHPAGTGYAAFGRAQRAGLIDGWAALVRSPSGGLHAYYPAIPGDPHRSWQAPAAHVDFRGDGGYIVVPPSMVVGHNGEHSYTVIATASSDALPVDAPALRELLDPRPAPAPRAGPRDRVGDLDPERLARWVAARGEGERNRALFWAACRAAEAGVSSADAHAVLGSAAERAGLPVPEITTTIRSAYRTALPHAPARPALAGASAAAAQPPIRAAL
ncbi:bifunctional DNA primase/polymerase [Microbacterium sp. NPDC077057]|uniref:bifunctional DNA primase/polymerase n=1 Tax=Microbacterium sp. NPDC077057 TaxID=3154763 RepID=UPI00341CAAE0